MKYIILTLMAVFITAQPSFAQTENIGSNTAYVSVNGLVCDFCARALEKVFGKEDAVKEIDVNMDTKILSVFFVDGQNLDNDRLTTLVTDAGYNVEGIRREQ